ncbi:hypothetical protein [Pedobacter sp. UBA4863]|uniref:hypothetical protein n=1 Tax=Pedobacter sp. UBA4863 TaxID=1947060 RepID=UPI0025FCBF24|nr:hypothetical protein [Pedobacter sp. UBA4863]
MKKNLLTLMLLCFTYAAFAQKDTKSNTDSTAIDKNISGKNEIKLNLLMGILAMPEISYERIFENNTGLGLSVSLGLDEDIEYKLGFIPYYRIYFGNAKKSSGFFIEANAALMQTKGYNYYYDSNYGFSTLRNSVRWNVGMGAAIGGKFLTKNGFVGEISYGVGRFFNQHNEEEIELYPRVGITIGKRF